MPRMRLFYELVIDDAEDDAMGTDDRRSRLRQILTDAADSAPASEPQTAAGQVNGSRSAFVVGNNNTVVINLVMPKEGEGVG